jgi:hypothetical protein
MNVDIDDRDNHPFVAIMAFPNERLSFFDVEKLLKAQNTVSCNTPDMTAQCALASDAFKKIAHICYPGRNKAAAMVRILFKKIFGFGPPARRENAIDPHDGLFSRGW